MNKKQMLAHWHELEPDLPMRPQPIAYKHKGSTFAEDGIRIAGSPAFIDSVLSRLKDLLEFEGIVTRLQVAYQPSIDKETKQPTGSYVAYVQVHQRGAEGAMMEGMVALAKWKAGGKKGKDPIQRAEELLGV